MAEVNVIDLDLYEILGVDQISTTKDIKKAYRKKALLCHPDKNPDDAKAAERFHTLSKALEILIDASARAAYDKVLNAKKEAKARHHKLDARRKKLKEDLEAKEQASMKTSTTVIADPVYPKSRSDEDKLKAEIERLRKQGSKELKEEIELVRQQVEEEWKDSQKGSQNVSSTENSYSTSCRIRLRWKNEDGKSLYDEQAIRDIFSKYGPISAVVVSSKNSGKPSSKGGGIVEFETFASAEMALRAEKGFDESPLSIEYLLSKEDSQTKNDHSNNFKNSKPEETVPKEKAQFPCAAKTFPLYFDTTKNAAFNNFQSFPGGTSSVTMKEHLDFESLVLRRMRQAQERKRLEDEIKAQEDDAG